MVVVTKKKGESKDSLFRKFTRSFIEEEIIDDVRKKLFYKKPSILKKEKPDYYLIALEGKGECFRKKIYPEYKAH
jgi:ribosomal protein S21